MYLVCVRGCACVSMRVHVAVGDLNQKIIFCALWGHREPLCSGATWCRLLSWAQGFLGETRMEVEHLAVIQRKCAKCYQNWISRQQLCSMNGRGRERSSFQVTHGWNFPTAFFSIPCSNGYAPNSFLLGEKSYFLKIQDVLEKQLAQ